jgi:hypothetical protein
VLLHRGGGAVGVALLQALVDRRMSSSSAGGLYRLLARAWGWIARMIDRPSRFPEQRMMKS